jgi:hypothetical protein
MDMHSPATLRGHYQQDGGWLNGSRSVPLVDGAMAEPSCADQRAAHQRPDDASGPPAADFPPVPARTPRTSWDVIDKVAWSLFARIGWAPPVNCGEDIRTDLATFARDDAAPEDMKRAWDLKAPAHMQVKGSLIEYLKLANRRKREQGWWFDQSDTKLSTTGAFGLPCLWSWSTPRTRMRCTT